MKTERMHCDIVNKCLLEQQVCGSMLIPLVLRKAGPILLGLERGKQMKIWVDIILL